MEKILDLVIEDGKCTQLVGGRLRLLLPFISQSHISNATHSHLATEANEDSLGVKSSKSTSISSTRDLMKILVANDTINANYSDDRGPLSNAERCRRYRARKRIEQRANKRTRLPIYAEHESSYMLALLDHHKSLNKFRSAVIKDMERRLLVQPASRQSENEQSDSSNGDVN